MPLNLALIGAGWIGREHARRIDESPRACLSAVVDPSPAASQWAASRSVPHYETLATMLHAAPPLDGAIVATPNDTHVPMAMPLLARGIPLLVEKPIAGSMADGEALVEAVIETGVPILVGHHRRHSPAIQAAQRCIAQGTLGRLVAVQVATLFHKPPDYFDVTWRRGPAGGPILINLIHDIDTLRALAGEIVQARSITSSRIRGFPVEDTAAVLVQFASGALGTLLLSDTTTSPRSWEHTSGENPVFPHEPNQDCIFLSGTLGSLAIPSMRLWTQEGQPSWLRPFTSGQLGFETGDPLTRQLDHFCDVIEHQAIPLVTAADALRTLEITLQIRE